jgi:hypothetical protein
MATTWNDPFEDEGGSEPRATLDELEATFMAYWNALTPEAQRAAMAADERAADEALDRWIASSTARGIFV